MLDKYIYICLSLSLYIYISTEIQTFDTEKMSVIQKKQWSTQGAEALVVLSLIQVPALPAAGNTSSMGVWGRQKKPIWVT